MEMFLKDFYEINKDLYCGIYIQDIILGVRAKLGDPDGELRMNELKKSGRKEHYDFCNSLGDADLRQLPPRIKRRSRIRAYRVFRQRRQS